MPIMLKMSSEKYWNDIKNIVRSGLATTYLPAGTVLYDEPNQSASTRTAFEVVGFDMHFDPSLTADGYTHSITLCQQKIDLRQYDAQEAFLYVELEMPPATYRVRMPDGYDDANGGNGRSYLFTTTKNIPVGGQITLTWSSSASPSAVTTYSSPTSTTAIESLSLSLWNGEDEAVFVGTIKYDSNTDESEYGKLNQIQCVRYGYNNYYQSGVRQLINSSLGANEWWRPANIFDRPYSNRNVAGYLSTLNQDFVNTIATPEITHITNNKFEKAAIDGKTFSLQTEYKISTDRMFLLSHTEVNLSTSPNIGSVLDYYSGSGNSKRIKYRKDNGSSYYWWLRTPNPSNAHNVRHVHSSGALSHNNAHNTYGVAPACIIQ